MELDNPITKIGNDLTTSLNSLSILARTKFNASLARKFRIADRRVGGHGFEHRQMILFLPHAGNLGKKCILVVV
jgi:hypothetical protein